MRLEICENSFMIWGTPEEIAEFAASDEIKDKKILGLAAKKSQFEGVTKTIKMQGKFDSAS